MVDRYVNTDTNKQKKGICHSLHNRHNNINNIVSKWNSMTKNLGKISELKRSIDGLTLTINHLNTVLAYSQEYLRLLKDEK